MSATPTTSFAATYRRIGDLFQILADEFAGLGDAIELRARAAAAARPAQPAVPPAAPAFAPPFEKPKALTPFTRSSPVALEKSAPAAINPAPISPRGLMWTEARDEVLRDRIPAGRPTDEILAAVNSLPGEKVPNGSFVGGRSSALGLRRPEGWNPVTQSVDRSPSTQKASSHKTSEEPYVFFTPGRNAIIKRDWPAGVHADVIMARCNALYGKPLTNPARIGIQASALGVRRSEHFDGKRALRPTDDPADLAPSPSKSVEIRQNPAAALPIISPLDLVEPPPGRSASNPSPSPKIATATPAQRVTFAHEPPAVRAAAAKPPLPVHAPAPKPIVRPVAAAPVDLPVRTLEREARVRRGVAAGETIGQLISAVNCRQGARMTTAELQAWIAELKIVPERKSDDGEMRSEARRRILVAAFEAGDPLEQIAFKLNVLNGPKLDLKLVQNWVADLKLKRAFQDGLGKPTSGLARKDWNTALQWALSQGVKFPDGADDKTVHRIINQAREEAGMPQWQIVEPNRPRIGIPGHAIERAKRSA